MGRRSRLRAHGPAQPTESLKCWDQLARHAALSWEERLQALEIRRLIDPPGAAEEIARYEQQAISDPSALTQILVWHLGRGKAREALDLLARAGGRTDRDPMLYFIKAEALMQLKDWKTLDGLLHDSTIPPLEYLRSTLLAYLARADTRRRRSPPAHQHSVTLAKPTITYHGPRRRPAHAAETRS